MRKFILTMLIAVFMGLAGCANNPITIGGSPEAQIKAGADAHKAASTLATVLLKNNKITVSQAKSYSGLLHASSDALDSANATLLSCRKATSSTSAASPDPCAFGVLDVIKLATEGITNVRRTLDTK